MGTKQTMAKLKYNRATYTRYEISVRQDSKLNAILQRYKSDKQNNLSELIKLSLCEHIGIDRDDADSLYVPYRFGRDGEQIPNDELDRYFK